MEVMPYMEENTDLLLAWYCEDSFVPTAPDKALDS